MLVLENIVKEYVTGDTTVRALDDVTLAFRKNEFVSILGHSGCGKTTMLNIIGGLDRYTSGVMSIKGISTEKYKDVDWDAYRNHSIGFVFQSYNLIPHQTVLSNVELALTLSGVSSAERKRRAKEVLAKVGLADQMHKKPNQMSGGQMQRVAIARALINDPEILLADEPTGALDTETSVQIMDILKEISNDKLIIMVTHNPELAEKYSDRIIRLSDGRVVGDTAPYSLDEAKVVVAEEATEEVTAGEPKKAKNKQKKPSMSFLTALSLSLNNLLTKKTRTFMTSFAGSIGIIGIALILSLSNGITAYINKVQRDTLSSYPIIIQKEEVDMSSMIASLMGSGGNSQNTGLNDKVYVSTVTYDLMQSMLNPETSTNNLVDFKKYLETDGRIKDLASLIRYGYDVDINAYVVNGTSYVKSDIAAMYEEMAGSMGMNSGALSSYTSTFASSGMTVWQEMLPPEAGSTELVHGMIKEQYDLVAGKWPEKKNEIMLVVTGNNEISDMTLYSLGLVSAESMMETMLAAMKGETVELPDKMSYEYYELIGIKYKVIPTSAYYKQNEDGEWINVAEGDKKDELRYIVGAGLECEIVGIIRQNEQTSSGVLSGTLVYTSALTDYLIDETAKSEIVKAQLENPDVDILSGLPFDLDEADKIADNQKAAALNEYLNSVSDTKKAEIYRKILTTPTDNEVLRKLNEYLAKLKENEMEISENSTLDQLKTFVKSYVGTEVDEAMLDMYLNSFDNASDLYAYIEEMMIEVIKTEYAEQAGKLISDIENTPSGAELDAEMVREIMKIMPVASQCMLLKMVLGADASAKVDAMDDATVMQTLDSMMKMYGASGDNKNLYGLISMNNEYVSEADKREYIVNLFYERTGLNKTVIENEINNMSPYFFATVFKDEIEKQARANYAANVAPTQSQTALDTKVAKAFMVALGGYTDAQLIEIYDTYVPTVSSSTFADNCELLGITNKDDPSSISIYAKNFEDKQLISDLISEYNATQTDDNNKISYTDYVGLLFSSITKIIDAISYVLIFFVSISLVVSSIMIGIITYISVLERTKEIGILRAMGASKRDVSRVFNAETLIVGFVSGMIGIIVTVLLNIPIGIIIKHLSDISGIAVLPIGGAVILVAISMALTLIAGLIPSRIAAKKDPVEALRTE